MIYSAFFMGLVGSLHCIGMCGPLAMLLPNDKSKRSKFIIGRTVYNLGRITTYTFLGIIIGLLGEQISFYIPQKIASITLGSLILIYFILPEKIKNQLVIFPFISRFTTLIKKKLAQFYSKHSVFAQFVFGILNGFLPCGMIYAALSGAFLMSSVWESGLFMFLFGVGTLPIMLSISFFGNVVRAKIGTSKLPYKISYIVLAVWLLFRGINPINHFIENHIFSSESISVCR